VGCPIEGESMPEHAVPSRIADMGKGGVNAPSMTLGSSIRRSTRPLAHGL